MLADQDISILYTYSITVLLFPLILLSAIEVSGKLSQITNHKLPKKSFIPEKKETQHKNRNIWQTSI